MICDAKVVFGCTFGPIKPFEFESIDTHTPLIPYCMSLSIPDGDYKILLGSTEDRRGVHHPRLCLDLAYGARGNGAAVWLWEENGADSQVWHIQNEAYTFTAQSPSGPYDEVRHVVVITSPAAGGRCIDEGGLGATTSISPDGRTAKHCHLWDRHSTNENQLLEGAGDIGYCTFRLAGASKAFPLGTLERQARAPLVTLHNGARPDHCFFVLEPVRPSVGAVSGPASYAAPPNPPPSISNPAPSAVSAPPIGRPPTFHEQQMAQIRQDGVMCQWCRGTGTIGGTGSIGGLPCSNCRGSGRTYPLAGCTPSA